MLAPLAQSAGAEWLAALTNAVSQILALPITVIGTYFAAEYEEYLRSQVTMALMCTRVPVR